MRQVKVYLRKPAVSTSVLDWQLNGAFRVEYRGVSNVPVLVADSSGYATLPLPLPGKYRVLVRTGNNPSIQFNGTWLAPNSTTEFVAEADLATVLTMTWGAGAEDPMPEVLGIEVWHHDAEYLLEGVEGASVEWSFQDVRDPSKRKAGGTRTITVPPTVNNMAALGQLFELNIEGNYDPRRRAKCFIDVDGIKVIDGFAQLVAVNLSDDGLKTVKSFTLEAADNFKSIFSAIGEKLISDLDFSEYTHACNWENVRSSGYSMLPDERTVVLNGEAASNYQMEEIGLASVGYSSPNAEGILFYTLTFSSAHGLSERDWVFVTMNQDGGLDAALGAKHHWGEQRVKTVIDSYTVELCVNAVGELGMPVADVRVYTSTALGFGYVWAPYDNGLDADIQTGNPPTLENPVVYPSVVNWSSYSPLHPMTIGAPRVTISRMRPSVFLAEVVRKAIALSGMQVVSAFFDKDQDFNRIVLVPWVESDVNLNSYKWRNADGTYSESYMLFDTLLPNSEGGEGAAVFPGSPTVTMVNPGKYLPKEKLSDFLGDVFKMFNLYVQSKGSVVYIEPRNKFYSSEISDWNAVINRVEAKLTLLPELTARTYDYSQAKGNDVIAVEASKYLTREFGSVIVQTVNEFKDSKVEVKLKLVEPVLSVSRKDPNADAQDENRSARQFIVVSSKQEDGKPLLKGVRLAFVRNSGFRSLYYDGDSWLSTEGIAVLSKWASEVGNTPMRVAGVSWLYPSTSHVDCPDWPMFDLNFRTNPLEYPAVYGEDEELAITRGAYYVTDGLYARYHARQVAAMTSERARMLSGTAQLTQKDIADLDFRRLISFNHQLWQLNKLEVNLQTLEAKYELLLQIDTPDSALSTYPAIGVVKPKPIDDLSMFDIWDNQGSMPNDPISSGNILKPLILGSVAGGNPKVPLKPGREGRMRKLIVPRGETRTFDVEGGATVNGSTSVELGEGVYEMYSTDGIAWEILGGTRGSSSPGVITVSPSTRQDNYNPSGLADAATIFLNPTASLVISGLQSGSEGRAISLLNVSDYLVILENDSPDSTASNRFYTTDGMAIFLMPRRSVSFIYSTVLNRWVCTDRQKQFDEYEEFNVDTPPSASADIGRFYQHAQNGGSIASGTTSLLKGPGILLLQTGTTSAVGNAKFSMGGRTGFKIYAANHYFLSVTQLALDTTFTPATHQMQVATGLMNAGAITTWFPPSGGAYWFIDSSNGVSNDWRISISTPGTATSTALTASAGVAYSLGVFTRKSSGADFFYSTNSVRYEFAGSLSGNSTQGAYVTGAWGASTIGNKRVFVDTMAYNVIQTK